MHPTHLLARNVQVDLGWKRKVCRGRAILIHRGKISYKSYCQASSSKVAREDFPHVPYNSSNSKGGYYIGHELDERLGSSFGHYFTICAHQIFPSWFYDSASYGP